MNAQSATGGAEAMPAPAILNLELLASVVKAAQQRKLIAGQKVLEAQEELRLASTALLDAEADFQAACPVAFGIEPALKTEDLLGAWLAARCDLGLRTAETASADLLADFQGWIVRSGAVDGNPASWSHTRFGRHLSERGIGGKKDRHGHKVRVGIRLRGEVQADG